MNAPLPKERYRWRQLTPDKQKDLLAWRKAQGNPWHSPPHREAETQQYHITAACFEHHPYIGHSMERMQQFSTTLLSTIRSSSIHLHAWCVLPNHYHLLVKTDDIFVTLKELGKMHGRTSFLWNGEKNSRGRQVWCNAVERSMRNERHYWATLNYIHNNPVHHRYAAKWQDWPFSSSEDYLASIGADQAKVIWKQYPVLAYGKGWDDAEL